MKRLAAIAILLFTTIPLVGCGAAADEASDFSDEGLLDTEGDVAQTSEAITSGLNLGECRALRSNPCANLCGWNWCNYTLNTQTGSQAIWCGACPW